MADELPSATPNPSGENQPAANKTAGEIESQPAEKLKPSHIDYGKEPPLWLQGLEGGGFIAALVIWAEMSECHVLLTLFFYFCALLGCYVGVCHLFYQSFKNNYWAHNSSILLWLILALITAIFVCKNSRPVETVNPHEYKLLAPDVALEIVKDLRRIHQPAVALIHAVDPDESAYAFSKQLEQIFRDGGYGIFTGPAPVSIPEVPGVSCFLYCAPDEGLMAGLFKILENTGSHHQIAVLPGDADPWFTNPVVVIMIRKK